MLLSTLLAGLALGSHPALRGDAPASNQAAPQNPPASYHAFLSKPLLHFSHRVGDLYREEEKLGEMLNELRDRGHAIDTVLHVPEAPLGTGGAMTNRILVITQR